MKFGDGKASVELGMKLFYTNGQSGQFHARQFEGIVTKIGNKLIQVESGEQFYIDTGQERKEIAPGTVYSSKEAYDIYKAQREFIMEVSRKMKSFNMTYDQATKINEILK